MSNDQPRYEIYSNDEAPPELYRFRHSIYVEEMGRKQQYACAETRTIRDPLDATGHQGIVFRSDEIVGCIRMNLLKDGPVGNYFDFYDLGKLSNAEQSKASTCTRLMISPALRKTVVSINLVKFAYEFGLKNGVETCFIDCNHYLTRFFRRFGWRPIFRRYHDEYGLVDVMRLDLRDFIHLAKIRSPFVEIAARYSEVPIAACAE